MMTSGPTRWILLLLLGGLLTACQEEPGVSQTEEGRLVLGAAQQTDTLARGVDLAGRTLVLDGFRGTIRLDGQDTVDVARLTIVRRARGEDADAARKRLQRVTVEEEGDADAFRYVLRARNADQSAVDVRGTVPRSTPVRIQWESGAVALSNVAGPIRVRSQGSTVDIAGAGATVDVETRNGAMTVAMANLPDTSRVRLRTANGDLALTLPATTAARVEARTDAGDINTDALAFTDRRLSPLDAGARFQGQLGTGGATIELRTENGDVLLREGRLLTLPDEVARPDPVDAGTTATDTLRATPPAADTTDAVPPPTDAPSGDVPPADTTSPSPPDTTVTSASGQRTGS